VERRSRRSRSIDINDNCALQGPDGRRPPTTVINAHRPAQEHHAAALELLEAEVNARAPFALSELLLARLVRIGTNPRAFAAPTPSRRRTVASPPPR